MYNCLQSEDAGGVRSIIHNTHVKITKNKLSRNEIATK